MVGIDAEAGPTEIAILADDTADPVHVAADLISQAEHDPMAASVLVTDSLALADAVDAELERQVALTKHVERVRAALTGPAVGDRAGRDLEQGLDVVNAYAAEHLEIITADARALGRAGPQRRLRLRRPYAPVSLGDYCAGSNHVLPTGCTPGTPPGCRCSRSSRACTSSSTTAAALAEVAPHVLALAGGRGPARRTAPPSRSGCQ